MFSNRTKTLAQPDTTRHKGAVLAIWESANIDFICFINKEVNHRHRKSRPGGLRFVFEFAQAAANHFLRKNLQNLRSGTIVATVACRYFPSAKREVCKCDRFCKGNFIVWSLDISGEFPWQLDYTPCCETIYKDIALFLRIFFSHFFASWCYSITGNLTRFMIEYELSVGS